MIGPVVPGCEWWASLLIASVAAIVSWLGIRVLIPILRRHEVLDIPGSRSSHDVPTPRGGGLGIIAGIAVGVALASSVSGIGVNPVLWAAMGLVALVGWADDQKKVLPIWVRLASQFVAAAMIVGAMGGLRTFPLPAPADIEIGWMGSLLSVLWIVGVTNVYNFLDGIDGYAGTQGVIAGLGFLFIGDPGQAILGVAVAGACLGFLVHNWHQAKIFMGDVGSSTLGFLFAALPFLSPMEERSRLLFATGILLWFFLADGAFTLLSRAYRRERVWTAHRSHLYQRLVRTALRHDQVVIALGLGMIFLATSIVLASRTGDALMKWGTLGLALLSFSGLFLWVRKREADSARTG